ncbi:MAG: GNAT family N-acetyltransferase [Clostridia bacterium]|nr:GNAT family N-acetyltransferase [Eubacterium sp.]MBR2560183.1 GNAT family N-acetyltransferase [Bacillota bacterium]MBR3212543.1 GNAT family N-acetyltransferase [Bacillota bacterium]MCR4668473.1 GNAT family N-acetyltransferase [Clostridia bacterium]
MRIETEHLILRPYEIEDAVALFSVASDPNVGPHAGWKPHESVEESEQVLRDILLPAGAFAIVNKKDGRLIGAIALEPDRYRPDANSRELGYWLVSDMWNQGLMTEAARAVMKYGFRIMGLSQIGICTSPENVRSQAVIKKCGFTHEGRIRRTYKIFDGSLRDSMIYSITREEYEAMYGKDDE